MQNNIEEKIDNYIYIEHDGEIFKFKATFEHMDIVNAIESYVNSTNVYDFEVKSAETLEKEEMIKKFFPYLGKFRLEGSIKVTDNYFVPFKHELLKSLFLTYKTGMFTGTDFLWLYNDFSLAKEEGNVSRINFFKDFVGKMNLELLDKYSLEGLNTSIQLISKIYDQKGVKETYEDLRSILAVSKTNKERVNDLDLNDKFIEIIKNSEIKEIDKSIK